MPDPKKLDPKVAKEAEAAKKALAAMQEKAKKMKQEANDLLNKLKK